MLRRSPLLLCLTMLVCGPALWSASACTDDTTTDTDTGTPPTDTDTGTPPTDTDPTDTEPTDTDPYPDKPYTWSNGLLTHQASERVGPGSTWTGISATDDYVYVTAKDRNHLWLFQLTFDLEVVQSPVQLTFDEDVPTGNKVADHKILIFEDNLYIGWNPTASNDMYLMGFDLEGNRIFDQITVERMTDVPTTDVHLATDGDYLYLVYGDSGLSRRVAVYDAEGNTITEPYDIDFDFKIDQLGTTVWADEKWNMFTGDEPTNNLVVSFFNHDWSPQSPFSEVLVEEEDHDFNWFPTGVKLSEQWDLWLVLYHHMFEGESFDDNATIEMALFDRKYKLQEEHYIGPPEFHAADITATDGCVFVATAFGDIYVDRYVVNPPDGWPEGEEPGCSGPSLDTGSKPGG